MTIDGATEEPSQTAPQRVRDRRDIETFLLQDKALHLYELGDLDPFFWGYTEWYGARSAHAPLAALVLVYSGTTLPSVLAFERTDVRRLARLLRSLDELLPDRFHAHFSPGVADELSDVRRLEPGGRHLKMLLTDAQRVRGEVTSGTEFFEPRDQQSLQEFYQRSYPGHWFDGRMLQTGQYVGSRDEGTIVCAAGVHVFSPAYGVAALGNVATDPRYRRRGFGRRATARLCQSLLDHVDTIGLNVKASNRAAISCYESLGFTVAAEYDEFMVERLPFPKKGRLDGPRNGRT